MLSSLRGFWNKWPFRSKPVVDANWGLEALPISIFGKAPKPVVWLKPRLLLAFVLVGVFYLFAGETDNQWFYLLAAAILSVTLVGIFLPLFTVLGLDAKAILPPNAVMGESVPIKIILSRRTHMWPLNFLLSARWLVTKINLCSNNARVLELEPVLLKELSGESQFFIHTHPLPRGVLKVDSIEIYSCYPFAIVWCSRKISTAADASGEVQSITVYPPLVSIEGHFLYRLRAVQESRTGALSRRMLRRGQSMSVKGVREFRHGDSPRMVHWPSSARLGKLLVREYESEVMPGFDMLLNLRHAWRSEEQFELAVALTYSIVHLGYKTGFAPELIVIPNLDVDAPNLPAFMADMPTVLAGLEQSSEILARVERVFGEAFKDEKMSELGALSSQALLTARPAAGSLATDDELDLAVELAVIPRTHPAAVESINYDVHMPIHEAGIFNRRLEQVSSGRTIAVVTRFDDFVKL